MEFYGPYRELFARIYQRCVRNSWFGPEVDNPSERAARGFPNPQTMYMGHLPEEVVRRQNPCLQTLQYEYSMYHGTPVTIVDVSSDIRFHRFGLPPATPEQLARTEAAIGFALPQILHDLYTQVANGGFGYWIGFVGAESGAISADLQTIDKGTRHNSWKLTDRAPNGLIGRKEAFKCFELPDRFIPWVSHGCTLNSWIDGWTGHVYLSDVYTIQPLPLSDEDSAYFDEVRSSSEPELRPAIQEYAQFEASDRAASIWGINSLSSEPPEEDTWCYGLLYEAESVEAWLHLWLDYNLPNLS